MTAQATVDRIFNYEINIYLTASFHELLGGGNILILTYVIIVFISTEIFKRINLKRLSSSISCCNLD